ncbi:MAG: hypothetical protein ACI8RZ_006931 [Myxococcota bacterium]|jgi:hypothetical protein
MTPTPPVGLEISEHLSGLSVVLRPPGDHHPPNTVRVVAAVLCAGGGLTIAGELASRASLLDGGFSLALLVGAVIGGLSGLTGFEWVLRWVVRQQTLEETERCSVTWQQLTLQRGSAPEQVLPFDTIERVDIIDGNLLIFQNDREVVQIGAGQPMLTLQWLSELLKKQHRDWQVKSSSPEEIPVALQQLRKDQTSEVI